MRLFLDACVLYPLLTRRIAAGLAEAGLIEPRWSGRVLAEWIAAAAREGGIAGEVSAAAERDELEARFPGARVPEADDEGIHLPDPADAHVVAAAVASGCDAILTFNIRDFPARRLAAHGIAARHPDDLFWELYSGRPREVGPVISAAVDAVAPGEGRRLLKRAHLPRLGKAWAADAA